MARINEAFWRWFGNSVVRNADGSPQVVYHSGSFDETENPVLNTRMGVHFGTKQAAMDRVVGKFVDDAVANAQIIKDSGRYYLEEFEYPNAPSSGFRTKAAARGWVAGEANNNVDYTDLDVTLTKAYLSIQRPKSVADQGTKWAPAVRQARSEGYDGIVYRNKYEDKGSLSFIVFSPSQIKSVRNRGTFDPNDPSILNGLARWYRLW